MSQQAKVPSHTTISATITRADGTIEEVGVVAATYDNPLRQWWWDHVGAPRSERRIRRANESARSK